MVVYRRVYIIYWNIFSSPSNFDFDRLHQPLGKMVAPHGEIDPTATNVRHKSKLITRWGPQDSQVGL